MAGTVKTSNTHFQTLTRSGKDVQTPYAVHWISWGKTFEQQEEKLIFLSWREPTNYMCFVPLELHLEAQEVCGSQILHYQIALMDIDFNAPSRQGVGDISVCSNLWSASLVHVHVGAASCRSCEGYKEIQKFGFRGALLS